MASLCIPDVRRLGVQWIIVLGRVGFRQKVVRAGMLFEDLKGMKRASG